MILDLITAILIVIAVVKGYQRGLIVAVFSVVALIIGLAAALKLSVVVAGYIGNTVNVSEKWLPFIAFIVVLVVVVILVRIGAKAIQSMVESMMLGWVNRIGGMVFFTVFYLVLYSVLLFYAAQLKLVTDETISASVTYPYIAPWAPVIVEKIGVVLPWFSEIFEELKQFFEGISRDIPPASQNG